MTISQDSTAPGCVSDTSPAGALLDNDHRHATYRYPKHVLGRPRAIRIIVIGCGVAGIAAAKLFKERFKEQGQNQPVELVIYEKNADVGGTWLENRYPGCACDVPAHAYTYSWEGNPNWSQAYVTSPEIFDYFQGRAKAYGVYDYVHLNHRVMNLVWKEETGKWQVQVEDTAKTRTFVDEANIVINATGFLNNWKWPDIPGIKQYRGHLAHSARWDDSFDFAGKKVAIIGNGSSAIQIVPIMQATASHLISFNRSPTWITPEFAPEFAPEGRETRFSEEQKAAWAKQPKTFLEYRKHVEGTMNRRIFSILLKNSQLQKDSFQQFQATMRKRLGEKKAHLADKLIPDFAVGCRRVTPGNNYLESLAANNVTVECGQILKITSGGIEMEDGTSYIVDAIICATGFDTSFRPAFPVIGEKGADLRNVWAEEPRSYLSIAASGFPNLFFTSGPNFPLANGSLIPCLELTVDYAFKAAQKLSTQSITSLSPKSVAVDDFQQYKDALMPDLAWSSGCRSWYKLGKVDGKVWGPWPGSALHFLEAMNEPRWEDWDIKYGCAHEKEKGNRFSYFGNGQTEREENGGDLSWYVREPGA